MTIKKKRVTVYEKTQRNLGDFEAAHGGHKIKDLQRQLEIEHTKVENLANMSTSISVVQSKDNMVRFGVTGDRHHGSLYHHSGALSAFYDHCLAEGIDLILDAGDMADGHKVYRGQEFELRDLGFEAQISRIIHEGPQSIKTKFITGNHDASFKTAAGVGVGSAIQLSIPNYEFVGEEQGHIKFQVPNGELDVMLIHPGGGSSYALSYRPQKIIESLEGGTKPDILCIGHYHKADMLPMYRNVCAIQTGTFQRQTPFMARQGLAAHVGGWIVEVWVGEGHKRIRSEFVAFYE